MTFTTLALQYIPVELGSLLLLQAVTMPNSTGRSFSYSAAITAKVCACLHMQIADDSEGPSTQREYQLQRVPVGSALSGQVVNFLGCPLGSQVQLGMDAQLPLLNDSLDMKSREQINTALFTGVKVSPQIQIRYFCAKCCVVVTWLASHKRMPSCRRHRLVACHPPLRDCKLSADCIERKQDQQQLCHSI